MFKLHALFGLALSLLLSFPSKGMNSEIIPTEYTLKVGNFSKNYPVVTPKGNDKVSIAYVSDFRDNTSLALASAKEIVQQLQEKNLLNQIGTVVIPGDKANMLGAFLWMEITRTLSPNNTFDFATGVDFCILSPSEKSPSVFTVDYSSITGGDKKLPIREDQVKKIEGKNILVFDDVVSTGGTLSAMQKIVEKSGGKVLAFACAATEGEKRTEFNEKPLFSVAHLPVYMHEK